MMIKEGEPAADRARAIVAEHHRKVSVKIKSFKVCRLGFRAYCECSICAEAFLMFYSTKIIKN